MVLAVSNQLRHTAVNVGFKNTYFYILPLGLEPKTSGMLDKPPTVNAVSATAMNMGYVFQLGLLSCDKHRDHKQPGEDRVYSAYASAVRHCEEQQ